MASSKTKTPPKYNYKPLPTGMKKPIRLLKVWRDPDTQSIAGKLSIVSLDDPNRPQFTTLSYVWDHKPAHQTILLDNRTHLVQSASLYPVLEAICSTNTTQTPNPSGDKRKVLDPNAYYWIDAICINQDDPAEQKAQIPLMGALYGDSTRTVIWLDAPSSDVLLPQGMDFLVKLSQSLQQGGSLRHHRHGDRTIPHDLAAPEGWKALRALLKLPWWRRVWTLQELVLSREACFFCGPERAFTGGDFGRALQAMYLCNYGSGTGVDDEGAWLPAWSRGRLMRWYKHEGGDRRGLSLVALMAYTSDFGVSYAEDLMYGMLGLASKEEGNMLESCGLMGYSEKSETNTVELLYSKFVKMFIQQRKSLDIICFAGLFRSGYATKSDHRGVGRGIYATASNAGKDLLPTWVPDWRVYRASFVVPLMVSQSASRHVGNFRPVGAAWGHHMARYAASGDREPAVTFLDELRRLRVVGFVLDYVDGLGKPVSVHSHNKEEHELLALVQSTSQINTNTPGPSDQEGRRELFRKVVRAIVLGRKDRYLSSSLRYTSHFRHQLTYLAAVALNPARYEESTKGKSLRFVYRWAFRWLRANQSLLIQGIKLGDLLVGDKEAVAKTKEVDDQHHDNVPEGGSSESQAVVDLSVAPEGALTSRLCDTAEPWKMGKRLLTTEPEGLVGMGPARARKGDWVCVLFGCSVPVVLRRKQGQSKDEQDEKFEFVGECYVDGYMNGEVFKTGRKEREFVLV